MGNMVIESIVNIFCGILDGMLRTVSFVQIPTQGISVLATVACYGSYVVGADLLFYFASAVSAWMLVKLGLGIGLFLWRLLPFT